MRPRVNFIERPNSQVNLPKVRTKSSKASGNLIESGSLHRIIFIYQKSRLFVAKRIKSRILEPKETPCKLLSNFWSYNTDTLYMN